MFIYKNGELTCEKVKLSEIASEVGTPFYVYSQETLLRNFRRIKNAFASLNPVIAYSVKANSNLSILRLFAHEGSGFDIVSGGELIRVLKAGGLPEKIIYAGVGKSIEELTLAVKSKIMMVNLESEAEAEILSKVAQNARSTVRAAMRINPDVEAHTHEYITTGKKENKFGVSYKSAPAIISRIARLPNIEFVGLHVHVGSQILDTSAHVSGAKRLASLLGTLRSEGVEIRTINIGGGFGIGYMDHEKPMNVENLSRKIIPILKKTGCRVILEPGRFIVAPAGMLITSINYVKSGDQKQFAIVDAGMSDLIRPSLYKAYHRIIPVKETSSRKKIEMDIVGPICESADFFGKERRLPQVKAGDLLAICDAGAYGYVMASNYNTRRRPPEILVKGNRFFIIKKRESYDDLFKGEEFPPHLK
ncbi:diaminopimelate decarboxylase [Candidatus Sumerlaeota bacterium]|nr:diaminopimelate decarboxylase [Candidatus Sumerlaeota bacterium]